GCAFVAPWASVVIGGLAGVVVILAIDLVEALKIDDPVGAFAVHGACGIFGTLMIGLVGQPELTNGVGGLLMGGGVDMLVTQFIGSAATIIWVGVTSFLTFGGLKMIGRLRVASAADEVGIDIYEHGASLWPDILPVPSEGAGD
ncbi:MAG: ammonium transporter, partial [Anaerolineae bacterium]|nr:ammonium transporter [Anaerolineae bacterium]